MRTGGLLLAALVALTPVGPAYACANPPQPDLPRSPLYIVTGTGQHGFSVELARTEEEKSCGLMMRQRLGPGEGMLFEYRPPQEAWMWMQNTAIPLDMLFIAPDGRIVHIVENTKPFSREFVGTRAAITGVLELRAGTVERLKIKPGDRVRHALFGAPFG